MQLEPLQLKRHSGLVTLVFTDMVDSTAIKQQLGDHAGAAFFEEHHALVRQTLVGFPQGEEIQTAGDSFLIVFTTPSRAVEFALLLQSRLRAVKDRRNVPAMDRIGIHLGEVLIKEEGREQKPVELYGIQIDTCARVMSLAKGSQILMTRAVFDSARQVLKGEDIEGVGPLGWMNHGLYALKGVEEPVEICEVGEVGAGPLTAPVNSDKARRHLSPGEEPVLGWRPALDQVVPNTKWILEKKLGEGGFGEVWLGRHEALKERRVFKFCFRADRVRSLKREVTLFRLLKERVGHHPNIVGIQEVFFDEPPFYIVMDYAEGSDLRSWCEAQGGADKVALATRLEIVAQVADALRAAHETGIIHRDVKPSNILISNAKSQIPNQKPEVKLTDFGIGQVVSEEMLAGMTRMGFTQTMLSLGSSSQTGTHVYMAPELFSGQPASSRSDIYSLGVVLYQLLISDFSRPVTTDWAKRINDPLLQEDLEKCFAGTPEERFASAGELSKNLRSFQPRQTERAAGEKSTRRKRMARTVAMVGIILVVLVSLGVLAGKFLKSPSDNPGTNDPLAYDLYSRGESYVLSNTSNGELTNAVKFFGEAILQDPKFARAYAGLAVACRQLDSAWEPGKGWDTKAAAAADKALSLDRGLADAWVVRGSLFFTPAEHWNAARDVEYQRMAIQKNPKVKNAHFNLAFVYVHFGFLKETIEELDKELKDHPLDSAPQWMIRSLALMTEGEYQKTLDNVKDLSDGAFYHSRIKAWHLGLCLFYLGKTNEASSVLEDSLKKLPEPNDPLLLSCLAIIDATRGEPEKAKKRIKGAEAWEKRFIHFHHVSYNIASAYALLGEKDLAMKWLRESAQDGNPCLYSFENDPNLRKLHDDPAFQLFLAGQRTNHARWRDLLIKN